MRFEIQYPEGIPHDVELQGSLAVVGRDPSSDLVLHDVKCSRRHAVLEAGPDGIVVRDAGSANGVYLNGEKIERAPLKTGDVLRLGDTVLKVLPDEDVPGTLVMGPGDIQAGDATVGEAGEPPPLPKRSVPVPPVRPPVPSASAPAPDADAARAAPFVRRPLTLSVLAALWLMSVPMYLLGGVAMALSSRGVAAAAWGTAGLTLAALSAAMAWGLWSLQPWTRLAQMILAGLGLLVCPFTLASVVVLAYMLTAAGSAAFAGASDQAGGARTTQETAFALALLVTVLLGGVFVGIVLLLPHVATRLS